LDALEADLDGTRPLERGRLTVDSLRLKVKALEERAWKKSGLAEGVFAGYRKVQRLR
jgi:hypothetical protein